MNESIQKPAKKEKKDPASSKASSSKKKPKDGDEDEDEDGSKKKKPKRKKDPNAPKRAMSGFIFFSQAEREVHMRGTWLFHILLLYHCSIPEFPFVFLWVV